MDNSQYAHVIYLVESQCDIDCSLFLLDLCHSIVELTHGIGMTFFIFRLPDHCLEAGQPKLNIGHVTGAWMCE